jgi:tetratricopeptide (TPR) repeat protein
VTFISQRAESLMGLFYLLTLYCFVRCVESQEPCGALSTDSTGSPPAGSGHPAPKRTACRERRTKAGVGWLLASIFSCLFGVMSKEIIVTAPVMVFLYDKTFVAGSFRAAWQRRWPYYLGLASVWLLLARLMTGLNQRAVGFGQGVTWWNYALTSCRSVVLYLKLAIWPHPLVFDYGTNAIVVQHAAEIAPYALVLAVVLVGTAIALWRWPAAGYAGAWFFVILAPTSSVVPVVLSPTAEHRVYLSLAAMIALVVLGLHTLVGRRSFLLFAAVAVGLGWLTIQRNKDYHSELTILSDTVAKCPGNERAHENLGYVFSEIPGHLPDAISEYQAALRDKPDFAEAHDNLGAILAGIPGRALEAIAHFEAALRSYPDFAEAHNNLGIVLATIPGRLPEAISHYEAALKMDPGSVATHYNLGNAFLQQGRYSVACEQYEEALKLSPNFLEGHLNLGITFEKIGRPSDAIDQFEAALQIKPGDPTALRHLKTAKSAAKKPR